MNYCETKSSLETELNTITVSYTRLILLNVVLMLLIK
jgi:hypothetical protein